MKNQTLKSLTEAHAWIGLIISTVLFIVFITGSLSLFRDNINGWERAQLAVKSASAEESISYDKAISSLQQQYNIDTHHSFFMREPSEHNPFIEVYFATHLDEPHPVTGEDHQDRHLLLSPSSGAVLADADTFEFATFLYQLHYNLGLGRIGLYFVGVITLCFFVAILSGLVIHWRKIAKNFFQYRTEGKKDKWLDAHNLIGTMGLPFHIMYAFTGLVFNLVIIYQISYAVLLYGGNQTALLQAAGFNEPTVEAVEQSATMTGIDALREKALNTFGNVTITSVEITHFGDKNAVVSISAKSNDAFSNYNEVQYKLADQSQIYLTENNYDNAVRAGLSTIASLHFGDFAGYGMRLAFLCLGLATAYLIVSGNLMWIDKRAKQRKQSPRSLLFVKRLTSGAFIGVLLAISVGFALTTALPVSHIDKLETVKFSMFSAFIFALLSSQFAKQVLSYSKVLLGLSCITFCITAIINLVSLITQFDALPPTTRFDFAVVIALLTLMTLICWKTISRINTTATNTQTTPNTHSQQVIN
ncbi:PepSY-associated TM helix domain-containing protein [Pseudoalteromonas peptidolytica]|uniref:PepSY-associated TM helix domain-containing protein n=1 Tax=Pseudoalteromonas peptidolytica TaxID=61150 RepID=UPI00298E814D|nr:PepSY-associated TM helix domain-containing protein [Pseudoalteromonas peptidolytica]MDW7549148.1 PepSY-associated TM helix domain-containing protein [Pseudoalteromonas peptidolytica]